MRSREADRLTDAHTWTQQPFEVALSEAKLLLPFVRQVAGFKRRNPEATETAEQIWKLVAAKFGWHDNWSASEGVRCPSGVRPRELEKPVAYNRRRRVEPEKKRDIRVLEQAPDHEVLLRWAQKALGIDPERIHPDDVPSFAHLSMLAYANENPAQFWKWIKELDDRDFDTSSARRNFHEDNRRFFGIMDAILEERERKAALDAEYAAAITAGDPS